MFMRFMVYWILIVNRILLMLLFVSRSLISIFILIVRVLLILPSINLNTMFFTKRAKLTSFAIKVFNLNLKKLKDSRFFFLIACQLISCSKWSLMLLKN